MSMSNENTSDRLDKMEALLKLTIEGLAETRLAIAETKQLTESNGKAIQAMLDQRASDQLKHDQHLEEQRKLYQEQQQINLRLTSYIDGLGKMMSKIDEERPTVLRKLTTIENKLDSLSTIETKLDRIIEDK